MKKAEQGRAATQAVLDFIRAQTPQDVPTGILALAEAARGLHGDSVQAVLFYGSCLRTGNVHEGLADLYLLVDDYRSAFKSRVLASFNSLLPPNVFYLEVNYQGHTLRAKYAVLSLTDFRNGAGRWFHSYIWGRFAQQCGLVYVRDQQVAQQVHEALARAVMTFFARALPQMEGSFKARDLWARGLSLSYRSELRTEQSDGAARLFDANSAYYQALTGLTLLSAPFDVTVSGDGPTQSYHVKFSPKTRRLNGLAWRVRALQGKLLSVLRLLKGFFTFKGGVDYILWKIERHSGARVEIGPGLRRVPPLAVLVILWRLYRKDAFR